MTNDTQALARADAADAILQHPLIAEALGHYEQELITAWRTSKASAHKEREELHRMLQAQAHFRGYLMQTVVTGKLIRAKVRQPTVLERGRSLVRR